MGIAVEPVEPCYDSDCYYAGGETLIWWGDYGYTPPSPPSPPPWEWGVGEGITPPPTLIDPMPNTTPNVPEYPGTLPPPPPPSPGETPSPSEEDASPTTPLPPPQSEDPLYRVIGSLLSQRPAPAQATPVVVQGRAVNPWPIALVGLVAVGAVAYLIARRAR